MRIDKFSKEQLNAGFGKSSFILDVFEFGKVKTDERLKEIMNINNIK